MPYSRGRTRWKRFALVMVPGLAATAALGIAMAQGALAASFLISGRTFQLSADRMAVRGLSIYSMVDRTREGDLVPVSVFGAEHVKIDGLCQSVVVPIPVLGPYTLRLTGAQDKGRAEASDIFIDSTSLAADQADLTDIGIGVAAGSLTDGPVNPGDRKSHFFDPDGVAQQAEKVVLIDPQFEAVAISAATFSVPDLDVKVRQGRHECF
ncbi:DUF6230 family protein [Streptomyces formicae]|uniref:Cholesterol esterase n=1 Tax=Streptomyces formicae TaxID=1616117 RepID=A0ABY3WT83_9ACTN|nr:DUF6230 family protein [Streptomyces formicae]UNM14865.1 cholesterol esterase [Streptomyces formicae]